MDGNMFRAPVRKTAASVKFAVVAPEAKEKARVVLPAEHAISRGGQQLLNNVTDMSAKVATFEPGRWRLDGRAALPLPPGESAMEVGFWGAAMSGADCVLAGSPQITVTFTETQNIPMLEIFFDEAGGEWISDLEVWVYNGAGGQIYNERLAGGPTGTRTGGGFYAAAKVVVKLYKTSAPYRYPRVAEINFGETVAFDNNDIIDLSLSTEGDPGGKRFPISELNVTVANKGRFDQLNPESLARFLYKRQPFEYRHGAVGADGGVDWVYCGAYYLESWRVDDTAARFRALGKTALLENMVYEYSTLEKKPIGAWMKAVLERAGAAYLVDAAMMDSPPVSGFLGNVAYRAALTALAEAGGCLAYEDKHNVVRFVDALGAAGIGGTLTYDDMLKLPEARMESYYNGVNLTEYVPAERAAQVAQTDFAVAGSMDVIVRYSAPTKGAATATVSGGFTLANIQYYTMFMKATIRGTGTARVTVNGTAVDFTKRETFYPAPWRDPLEPVYALGVDLPMMLADGGQDAFRDWFLARKFEIMRRRLTCGVTWRQDPNIQLGDRTATQVNKGNKAVPLMVCEDMMEFSGGVLRGTTKLFGGDW